MDAGERSRRSILRGREKDARGVSDFWFCSSALSAIDAFDIRRSRKWVGGVETRFCCQLPSWRVGAGEFVSVLVPGECVWVARSGDAENVSAGSELRCGANWVRRDCDEC